MTQVAVFNHELFGNIRTVKGADGEPWFVASDIAKALEYSSAKDLVRGISEEDRGRQIVPTSSGEQDMTVINESGLYSAIIKSRKESAAPFKRWVTKEVLPSIRKTGAYVMGQPYVASTNPYDLFELQASLVMGMVKAQRELQEEQQRLAFGQQRLETEQQALLGSVQGMHDKLRYTGHDLDRNLRDVLWALDQVPGMDECFMNHTIGVIPFDHQTDFHVDQVASYAAPVAGVIDMESLARVLGVGKRLLLRVLRKYRVMYKSIAPGVGNNYPTPEYAHIFHVEKYIRTQQGAYQKKSFFKVDGVDELKELISDLYQEHVVTEAVPA